MKRKDLSNKLLDGSAIQFFLFLSCASLAAVAISYDKLNGGI